MSHPPTSAASGGAAARALRYAVRVPMLLWHVLVHLPVVLLLGTPLVRDVRVGGEPLGHRAIRWWQGGLMRLFGFRMRRIGTPLPGAVLFVSNHVSWIDIVALHSQRMMGFVAKREIAGWPVVGWLAGRGETIFHQRGNQESLGGVLQEMLARLRSGRSVGVFPEGRTRDGREVGPFHARIFLAAVEAGVAVQPVALRYGAGGSAQTIVAFGPHESFLANFLRLLGEPARDADVIFLEPILPGNGDGRRRIAEIARERIVAALGAAG
ncbi:1-acyl-sn-glycerol-3-phosphate acyltransferase [Luteimonas sp. BDR2-5]|uniref:lysophospholipid acyltransferase family protein n=1 Tax=Proluteimonas luteida TaxID=2878685 RepID=UPI001E5D4925|nr:lysophospholipid acyltransferase family protein [Luteimonas sp. BDR2-5]MCD9028035.1 1-acyl-sn-glycerol-3-phosphate acyltransferase [Luteimonas sp. BDR2-5]